MKPNFNSVDLGDIELLDVHEKVIIIFFSYLAAARHSCSSNNTNIKQVTRWLIIFVRSILNLKPKNPLKPKKKLKI